MAIVKYAIPHRDLIYEKLFTGIMALYLRIQTTAAVPCRFCLATYKKRVDVFSKSEFLPMDLARTQLDKRVCDLQNNCML